MTHPTPQEVQKALPYGLDRVPIRGKMVETADIPEPFRTQFIEAMRGQVMPSPTAFWAWDWTDWASGNWRWGGGPTPRD